MGKFSAGQVSELTSAESGVQTVLVREVLHVNEDGQTQFPLAHIPRESSSVLVFMQLPPLSRFFYMSVGAGPSHDCYVDSTNPEQTLLVWNSGDLVTTDIIEVVYTY